jgi:hypothetical protein
MLIVQISQFIIDNSIIMVKDGQNMMEMVTMMVFWNTLMSLTKGILPFVDKYCQMQEGEYYACITSVPDPAKTYNRCDFL